MATSNPLDILLAHDKWATGQILGACEKLTAEQFSKKFEMGVGSLQATVTHMLGAMRIWTDLLEERELRPRLEESGAVYSVEQLKGMLEETVREFEAVARRHPVEGTIKRTRGGKEYTFTRGAVVTHVATHGMHHRAQCLNMLRQLGVSALPASSVAEWTWMGDAS